MARLLNLDNVECGGCAMLIAAMNAERSSFRLLKAERDELRTENENLRTKLARYGQHLSSCFLVNPSILVEVDGVGGCTCGRNDIKNEALPGERL